MWVRLARSILQGGWRQSCKVTRRLVRGMGRRSSPFAIMRPVWQTPAATAAACGAAYRAGLSIDRIVQQHEKDLTLSLDEPNLARRA